MTRQCVPKCTNHNWVFGFVVFLIHEHEEISELIKIITARVYDKTMYSQSKCTNHNWVFCFAVFLIREHEEISKLTKIITARIYDKIMYHHLLLYQKWK